jgi:hypothetical protein
MIANRYSAGITVAALVTLTAFTTAYASDPPEQAPAEPKASTESAAKPAPGEAHMMMDHSPADTKSMTRMKDKKIPIHHAGDTPLKSEASSKPVDHMMMDHSPADTKSMTRMKDKKIPIHHAGDPPLKSEASSKPADHMMMDHSSADTKSMTKMKDKKIPIHHSGEAEPTGDSNSPKQ